MLATILEIIKGLLTAIPIFSKWFSKSATEKAEDAKEDVDKDVEELKKLKRRGRS